MASELIIDSYDAVLFDLDGVVSWSGRRAGRGGRHRSRCMHVVPRSVLSPTTRPARLSLSLITWLNSAFPRPPPMS